MRKLTRAVAVSSLALPVALGGVAGTASAGPGHGSGSGVFFHKGVAAAGPHGAINFQTSSGAFRGGFYGNRRGFGGGRGFYGGRGGFGPGGRGVRGVRGGGFGGYGFRHHRRHFRGSGVFFNQSLLAAGPHGAVAFNTSSGAFRGGWGPGNWGGGGFGPGGRGGWGPGNWGGGGWGPGGWRGGVFFDQSLLAAGPHGAVAFNTSSGAR